MKSLHAAYMLDVVVPSHVMEKVSHWFCKCIKVTSYCSAEWFILNSLRIPSRSENRWIRPKHFSSFMMTPTRPSPSSSSLDKIHSRTFFFLQRTTRTDACQVSPDAPKQ